MLKKFLITLATIIIAYFITYASLFMADLVGIGGYDGIAPEQLVYEFQSGKFSGDFIYGLTKIGAMIFMVLGPLLFIAGVLYIFIILFKLIVNKIKHAK